METIKRACALLYGVGLTTVAGTLLVAVPASAHTLASDHNLGKTTGWPSTGYTQEAEIPDVEGDGENTFRFEVERPGPVTVWTSGNFSPSIAVSDGTGMLTGWSRDHYVTIESAGIHYVRARSGRAGAYRLHIAGGGKGHDDIGNVIEEAAPIPPCVRVALDERCKVSRPDEPNMRWSGTERLEVAAKIDYTRDRDWFSFDVPGEKMREMEAPSRSIPVGPPVPVRVWSIGGTNVYGVLYDAFGVELEANDNSGPGLNFFIDRSLDPGTYYIRVTAYGTGPYRLSLAGRDDHGNIFETASETVLPTDSDGIAGEINYSGDSDMFWFQTSTTANVRISSVGDTNVYGTLYDAFGVELEANDNSGPGLNFFIDRSLDPGTYYIRVTAYGTGPYGLRISGDASGVVTVPLMLADGNTRTLEDGSTLRQWGFVRIINHSDQSAEVEITAIDDMGMRRELPPLSLTGRQTTLFNSRELEQGNDEKGIVGGVGVGTGDWYLEIAPSRPEVEVLSYVRTSDGFLSSMHTQVPSYGRTHRIATFNPGSNRDRKSKLRLIHPRCPQFETIICGVANVTIYGVDDKGMRSPDVQLQIASGAAREVTAAELEGREQNADGLVGSLGDGERKWQLFITADRPIHVMSLLERAAGHLTNLSAPASRHPYSAPERQ